jgi:hypothetical protein
MRSVHFHHVRLVSWAFILAHGIMVFILRHQTKNTNHMFGGVGTTRLDGVSTIRAGDGYPGERS